MNNKITLSINYKYSYSQSETVCYDIQDFYEDNAFNEPISRLSKPSFADIVLYKPTPEDEIRAIMKNRKEIAERISKDMTEFLLDQMAKKDTLDGYLTKDNQGEDGYDALFKFNTGQ